MKNKKTLSMLALGLLLGGGAIGALQVSANNAVTATNTNPVATAVDSTEQPQQVSTDTTKDTEAVDATETQNGVNEKDGIDHQFEGDEGNHQD